MRLGTRLIFMSVLPVIIMGVAGPFAITSMLRSQQKHLEDLSNQNAVVAMRRLDDIFHNVTRAADELANHKESLSQAVSFAQDSAVSDFFEAYAVNVGLKVMLATPAQRAVYRSWAPLNANPDIPSEQQGLFMPKIIQIDGQPHFAIAHSITDSRGASFGQAMVAIALDEKFLTALFNSKYEDISVGGSSGPLIGASHDDNDDEIYGRSSSSVIPSLWVEIHSSSNQIRSETVRAI